MQLGGLFTVLIRNKTKVRDIKISVFKLEYYYF